MLSLRRFWMLTAFLWGFAALTVALIPVYAQPASATSVTGVARPDLAPIPSRLEYGVVSVRNLGPAASGPSLVTIECNKAGQHGGCADIPRQYRAQYSNPAFPNRIVIPVPALAPGQVHNVTLPFWPGIAWASGAYQFEFVADAGAANTESNEGNNAGYWTKVVP